jgi:hypothetical protein
MSFKKNDLRSRSFKIRSKIMILDHFKKDLPMSGLCPLYCPAICTCFCAYTIQAHSTTNGKIWRDIQNPQMFETDPESFSPAILGTPKPRALQVVIKLKIDRKTKNLKFDFFCTVQQHMKTI